MKGNTSLVLLALLLSHGTYSSCASLRGLTTTYKYGATHTIFSLSRQNTDSNLSPRDRKRWYEGSQEVLYERSGGGGSGGIGTAPGNPVDSSKDPESLGVCFNKITFGNAEPPTEAMLPMTPDLYPISVPTADWMKMSDCPSVIAEGDCYQCQRHDVLSIEELIMSDAIGGYPTHPNNNTNSSFWEEFRTVVDIQKLRRENVLDPGELSEFCPPKLWENLSLMEVAEAVHDEYPGYHQSQFIAQVFSLFEYPIDMTIFPNIGATEFVFGIVMLASLNNWAVAHVGPINFTVKYHVGRARPEEIAWKISQGIYTTADGIPVDIVDCIMDMNLTSQFDFTAYKEGSPSHPSWPAMHSAASAMSLWLPVVLNLTEEEWCEAKKTDYAVSFARTVAGVHFPSDNIAGLNLGQELIARALPAYLADQYGSDPVAVQAKIDGLRFDWESFTESDCGKGLLTP